MAYIRSTSMTGGTVFAGSPVIIDTTAGAFPEESTFRQVVLTVSGNGREIPFNSEVSGTNDSVSFDISSALRSLINADQITPRTTHYPDVSFAVSVRDEYLLEGEVHTGNDVANASGHAILGVMYPFERLSTKSAELFIQRHGFTSKPTSEPELALVGMPYFTCSLSGDSVVGTGHIVAEGSQAIGDRKVVSTGHIVVEGLQTIGGRKVFGSTAEELEDAFSLCFLNRLGVLETVTAFGKFDESYPTERTDHSVTPNPSWTVDTLFGSVVTPGRTTFAASSGPVDHDWAVWWAEEFCRSTRIWVAMQNQWHDTWVPCTIAVKEKKVRNKAEQKLLSVDFEVKLAI